MSTENVPSRILKHRREVVSGVSGERVLKIQQPEVSDALPIYDQHNIFGVIVAKDRDRTEAIVRNRLSTSIQAVLYPVKSTSAPTAGQYQSVNSSNSASHCSSPCNWRPAIGGCRCRWTRTSVASSYSSHSARGPCRASPRSRALAEIAEQEQALVEVARENLRSAQADMKQAIRQRR